MAGILPYIQIVLAVLMVGGVLLQRSEAGLGSAFGGADNLGGNYHTKRGPERALFIATIVVAILFVISTFISLVI